jgi:hypothetical protein
MSADMDKPSGKAGEPSNEASRAKRAGSGPELAGLVSFTIDTRSGRIVRVEAVDSNGGRHELTAEERRRLATQGESTLEDIFERTFEAGISSVLDDEMAEEDEDELEIEAESEEESKLRRLILRPMIERSAAGRLLKREILGRAIVGTLIRDAAASQTSASARSSAQSAQPAQKAAPPPSRPSAGGSRKPSSRGRTQH